MATTNPGGSLAVVELFRFRVIRPIQAQPSKGLDAGAILQERTSRMGVSASEDDARSFLQTSSAYINPITWSNWLATFSSQLALRSDLVAPADCFTLLPSDVDAQVSAGSWAALATALADSLVAALLTKQEPAVVEGLCRLLLVRDLVTTLVADTSLPADEQVLQTAADVQSAVSWRYVTLPINYFAQANSPLLARQPGFTDLYVVNDEWNRYEPEELAQVINVLPGETFENRTKQSQEVDTLTETTTSTTTATQTEQDETTSNSLSEATTSDASLNIGVQGQVQTSGQYGPTHVQTSLGAQLQSSQTTSDSRASTTSYQTVQRSLKSISQTVTTTQATRTVTRDLTYDDHKLENQGQDVTVGLYRWLTEIHRVELVRYPNRLVLEFEIPEPGSWLRWALQNLPSTTWDHSDPGPFRLPNAPTDLQPTDITANNWTMLAAQWRVQGLAPPPPTTVTLSVKLSIDPGQQSGAFATATDNSLTVPTGYEADSWTAQLFSVRNWSEQSYGTEVAIAVGGQTRLRRERAIRAPPPSPQGRSLDRSGASTRVWFQSPFTPLPFMA